MPLSGRPMVHSVRHPLLMTPSLRDGVAKQAMRRGMSINGYIRFVLLMHLEREDREARERPTWTNSDSA
jgi:hypothetical protein